jgi:DNA topoisomerase-1
VERRLRQGRRQPSARPLLKDQPAPLPAARAARRDARASGLRYVRVDSPGIERHRAGRAFSYLTPTGRRVRGEQTLARIRAIAIPPAWTEVWISPDPKGHIQATGRDAAGRRQYRYHAAFRRRRDAGKFDRLLEFGEVLPRIRRRVRDDLSRRGLPREKVLAAVVSLLEVTSLRVGNPEYAALNKSFGLSTLRDRHARISGSTIRLRFRGKGGRTEERTVIDRRLASVVRRCQELPGQELFQYEDQAGEVRQIASEDVNEYIRDAAGEPTFSAKDFRTWAATVAAFRAMRSGVGTEPGARGRKPLLEALRQTAEELGNTLAVTRASYVHPGLVATFEADGAALAPGPRATAKADGPPTRDEELELLRLLRHASRTAGAARRSKAGTGRVAARSRRRRA